MLRFQSSVYFAKLMQYLRTKRATDWPGPTIRGTSRLLGPFDPDAENHCYLGKLHLVREWYVEFGDDQKPCREIGLDSEGIPVVSGPSEQEQGFWLGTDMLLGEFSGHRINSEEFESKWSQLEAAAQT
jgi:hypothetical protein